VDNHYQIWRRWADTLHRWGAAKFAANLLQALGPLNIVLAQAVHLGQPVGRSLAPQEQFISLAAMLEDEQETHSFIAMLREREQA
jgi:hypothetical protein